MAEEWRPIPGYEGAYEVSDLGRVRSLRRVIVRSDGHTRTIPERVLRPAIRRRDGYTLVALHAGGVGTVKKLHQLVLLAFVGPRPDGAETLHKDHNPSNNALVNLRYGTHRENVDARTERGYLRAIARRKSKLKDHIKIIRELNGTIRQKDIAAEFGTTQQTISAICLRKRWADYNG